MLCPEIAQNVQVSVLTDDEYAKESYKIYYDMANFDNIFTKKYRRWNKEGKKDFNALKSNVSGKAKKYKQRRAERKVEKQAKKQVQAEIKRQQVQTVEPKYTETKQVNPTKIIQPRDFEDQSLFDPFYLKRHKKNNLYGNYDPSRPELRDYDKL